MRRGVWLRIGAKGWWVVGSVGQRQSDIDEPTVELSKIQPNNGNLVVVVLFFRFCFE